MIHPAEQSQPVSTDARGERAIELTRKWVKSAAATSVDPAAARLAGVLKDPKGLPFTIGFVDGVMRPESAAAAASQLNRVAPLVPEFLPWYLRAAVRTGGALAPVLPVPIVPISRRVLREMVSHLIVDARPEKLGKAIARIRATGARLNLNLLGEAVLGEQEAQRRLDGIHDLIRRDDVDYVSVKVSAILSRISMWAFDDVVADVVERLTPLYLSAAKDGTFINLDMEEYRDLDLTIAVFTRLLEDPRLRELEAGIVLQAYLPDALPALRTLTEWAQKRVAGGGARIKVRLVKGANLAMEHVDSVMHGWNLATYDSKLDSDANYIRCLDEALRPENTAAVRLGIAGHNLFDIAYAWLLAKERGVTADIEFEMLLGMAQGQVEAVSREVGGVLLYVPVVRPDEFDVAISYLVRRLEENASSENFLSAAFELNDEQSLFDRERDRFLASLTRAADSTLAVGPHRRQDRATGTVDAADVAVPVGGAAGFHNAPDSDPALPATRTWAGGILARVDGSTAGKQTIADARISDAKTLESRMARTHAAGEKWGQVPVEKRAEVLREVAVQLEARRGELIEVAASETGKVFAEADVEVSEAVDFATYYAATALELDNVEGATFEPAALTLITPPWNFPVAIPAGGVLAALAAGSAVVFKPAPQARRCAAVVAEAVWAALDESGVSRDVVDLVDVEEGELGRQLISHPSVDRVILTGAWETAALFRSWRPELPLLAETSGKNAMIITASADLDLAAADLVRSAFGHAGQKCSAASFAILVGPVARSERFERQLRDAVGSLRVGPPTDPRSEVGPVVETPHGKLEWALTSLNEGEKWLVKPQLLDSDPAYEGRMWSPGVRTGVKPGSKAHMEEFFGPMLSILHAPTLERAVEIQNAVAYGLTAGLHTQSPDELAYWLENVQAGNLYVNRGTTGAIVQRQPFGGWKRSSVGAGTKAGGPNYLIGLGSWRAAADAKPALTRGNGPVSRPVSAVLDAAKSELTAEQQATLLAGAQSDAREWEREFGAVRDVSQLVFERNLFRYRSLPVAVRATADADLADVLRVAVAGVRSGAAFSVSVPAAIPNVIREALESAGARVFAETDHDWLTRITGSGRVSRARLVGSRESVTALNSFIAKTTSGSPDLAVYDNEVTTAGRLELLPFLHEQAITITAHRFGNRDDWSASVI